MDFWTLYWILVPVSIVLFWLGFAFHWRGEGMPVRKTDVKFLALFTALCFLPFVQLGVPLSVWVIALLSGLGRLWDKTSDRRALQKIADGLNSIVHYRKADKHVS